MATTMREIMSPAPVSLDATAAVADAAKAIKDHGIGAVLVVTDGRLSGLLTDRDIAGRVLAEDRDPLARPVGQVVSMDLAVPSPDDTGQAVRLIRKRAVRRIPVIENDTPTGVVSIGDLAIERDERSALSGVSAAPPNT